mgnify:CR=1 FL=1
MPLPHLGVRSSLAARRREQREEKAQVDKSIHGAVVEGERTTVMENVKAADETTKIVRSHA